MKSLIVLAHPEEKSFCAAMAKTAENKLSTLGEVSFSDLYGMNWDPISSRLNFSHETNPDYFKPQAEELYATEHKTFEALLEKEILKVESCEIMLWVFPLWWFSVPAILKGWVDKVFAMGRAYGNGRVYDSGIFKGKKALLCLTTGGPETAYSKEGFNGDINSILRHIHRGMLEFTGFTVLAPEIVYGPARLDDQQRLEALAKWEQRLQNISLEVPYEVGKY